MELVYADDMKDYVAIFEKSWPKSRDWAYNMKNIHNGRLAGGIAQ